VYWSSLLRANHRSRDHDGIGAHGQTTNGIRSPITALDLVQNRLPGQKCAIRIKRRQAAIDVIVAGAATGERELA